MKVSQGVGHVEMMKPSVETSTGGFAFKVRNQWPVHSWFILVMIITTQYAGALNGAILVISMESLKLELGLTDSQIGFLLSLPGICAGVGALILGYLADRAPRQIVLAACILLWSFATIGLGLATQFIGILLGIVALAFGESALGPVVNSMVPDLFFKQTRIKVNLILAGAGTLAGGLAAMAAGNLIALVDTNLLSMKEYLPVSSGVRGAFLIAGLLGLPIALIVLVIGKIKRQTNDSEKAFNFQNYLRRHSRALLGLYSSFALQAAGVLALAAWIPTYLGRRFEMSAAEVGSAFGKSVIAGSILGILLSLTIMHLTSPKLGQRTSYTIYLGGLLTAIIPTVLQLSADNQNMALYCVFFSVTLLTMGGGHTASMIQDVSPSQFRGRFFAILTLCLSVIPAAAPSVVGLISDGLTESSMSLIKSICIVSISCFLLSGLVLFKCRNSIFSSMNDHQKTY